MPSAATQGRSSKYGGGQANIYLIKGRNNARMGLYSFARQDDQFFHVVYSNGSNFAQAQSPTGSLVAAFVEDQFKVTSWLTLNGGLRQTPFFAGVGYKTPTPPPRASL